MNFNTNIPLDKVLGMFTAHFIGDALGAGYEFKTSNFANYNGVINVDIHWISRWIGEKIGPKGQTTDDTAMTLCLLAVLLQNQGHYINSQAIQAYNIWAGGPAGYLNDLAGGPAGYLNDSDSSTSSTTKSNERKSFSTRMIGRNTNDLFKYQVKPENVIKSYLHRYEKKFVGDNDNASKAQSNGALMRCSPFALLKEFDKYAHMDCYLTNPNPVCWECNYLYLLALQSILTNNNNNDNNKSNNLGKQVYQNIKCKATLPEVQAVFNIIDNNGFPDIRKNKGWVLNALAVALRAILFIDTPQAKLQDFLDWVIQLGGDTDTNACIGAAIIGAYLGYQQLLTEDKTKQNWDIITQVDLSNSELDTRSEYQGKDLRLILQPIFN